MGGARTNPGISNGATPLEGFGTTVGQPAAATTGTATTRARGPRSALLAGGVALALGAAGLLAYRATSPPPAPAPGVADPPRVSAPGADTDPAAPTVQLFILPADASVEVDDHPAVSRGGVVEITGALGSAHKVRVHLGADETTAEVFVTQKGANPPKVVLATSAPAATAAPRPTPSQKPLAPRPVPTSSLGLRPDR